MVLAGARLMPSIGIVIDAERTGLAAVSELCRRRGTLDVEALVARGDLIHLGADASIEIGALPAGMESGKPSIAISFALPDGRVVLAESSLQLLLTAADAFRAKYGDPRVGLTGAN